jgi:hypothetical protein
VVFFFFFEIPGLECRYSVTVVAECPSVAVIYIQAFYYLRLHKPGTTAGPV